MSYRDDQIYKALEQIIENAGIHIIYQDVPNDSIDGTIWARSDADSKRIMMPDDEDFPNDETACLILGHEMGHILTGVDSPDNPVQRQANEATCVLVGYILYKLAEETAGHKADMELLAGNAASEEQYSV